METFNEMKLIVITYHMMLFTDFVGDADTEYKIGHSCNAFLLFGTAINMTTLVVHPIKQSHHKTRLCCYKRKARVEKENRWGSKIAKKFHLRRSEDLKDQEYSKEQIVDEVEQHEVQLQNEQDNEVERKRLQTYYEN